MLTKFDTRLFNYKITFWKLTTSTHKMKMLFSTQTPVLIQRKRLRFGMVNLINPHLKLKILPT